MGFISTALKHLSGGGTACDLAGPGIEAKISPTDSDALNHRAKIISIHSRSNSKTIRPKDSSLPPKKKLVLKPAEKHSNVLRALQLQ